jgi:hypothetical protein
VAIDAAETGRLRSRLKSVLSVLWALLPLLFGFPSGPCFAWAAYRLRSRLVAVEAVVYTALTVLFVAVSNEPTGSDNFFVGLGLGLMATATVRAFVLRRRVFLHGAPEPAQFMIPAVPRPANWAPAADPAAGCTAQDTHLLTLPMRTALGHGALGAAGVVLVLALHLHGKVEVAAVGYTTIPVIVPLFSRWLDGPVLYYRLFGVRRSVRLDAVTQVDVSRIWGAKKTTLVLRIPGRHRISIGYQTAAFTLPRPARIHVRAWLDRPDVVITPAAQDLLCAALPAR